MSRLNGWWRLWLAGLVPWIVLNILILAEAIELPWLTGLWELIVRSVPLLTEPGSDLLFGVAVAGTLVSYLVLSVGVYVVWRAAHWIRAGFEKGEQPEAEAETIPSDDPPVASDAPLKSREAGA